MSGRNMELTNKNTNSAAFSSSIVTHDYHICLLLFLCFRLFVLLYTVIKWNEIADSRVECILHCGSCWHVEPTAGV